ncbi:hypothetical protein [Deinococcus roseus]|uniref:Uncharacterized protein n=1 Tax=Deinococcus roseus TaxID=392414 RepID=A0ABQ2D1J3_9DEIO|nr:hypothetical protein [Deinococcus roseus]GGJ37511.1 hypothetical protein GCM10008938_24560 [Deinococcus roseus]
MKKHLLCAALMLGIGISGVGLAQDDSGSMPGLDMGQGPMFTEEQQAAMAETAKRWGLPEGTVKVSDCVPTMGEHWARLQDLPLGPIYGIKDDRLVFVELMPSQEMFAKGMSWVDALKTPKWFLKIDHVDIEFQPQGHEGYPIPHYDIHAYFVPHAEHLGYCLPPMP